MGKEYTRPYTKLVSIIVESALPYALVGQWPFADRSQLLSLT